MYRMLLPGWPLSVFILLLLALAAGCATATAAKPTAIGQAAPTATRAATGAQAPSTTAPATPAGETKVRKSYSAAPQMVIDAKKKYSATIETTKGTIKIELWPDVAPKTVNNFVSLARDGYYDGITFHRYVQGFVIQGGDPTGTGTGGPGYRFADEPVQGSYKAGSVAMANSGPNTNGSQFFICLADQPGLPKLYNLFGQTTSGMDVVLALRQGDVMRKVTIDEQ